MNNQATLREILIQTQVIQERQWPRELGTPQATEEMLEALTRTPAWWSGFGQDYPTLTLFHRKLIARLMEREELHLLPRWLRWGQYLVLSEVGRGGMGIVYQAWDFKRQQVVALKRIRNAGQTTRSRFQREAQLLARLNHSNIAKFLTVESTANSEILVMEFVNGETAGRKVRRKAKAGQLLPWPVAVHWAAQVLEALTHAHQQKVIHRDIKPGNIMVSDDHFSTVKLLDVGLAKGMEEEPANIRLTRAGQILGTSEYMPPEQWASGTDVTPAVDLYALGGTLFYFLTAHSPFPGETAFEQMKGHLSSPPPSAKEYRSDTPASLDRVIAKMMAKDPIQRGTAKELAVEFNRILASAKSFTTPATTTSAFHLPSVPEDSGIVQNYSLGSTPSSHNRRQSSQTRPNRHASVGHSTWRNSVRNFWVDLRNSQKLHRLVKSCREQLRSWWIA